MPGTVLLMQNVDLGHTKVIKIHQRETLSHQGAIIHDNCCSAAQLHFLSQLLTKPNRFSTIGRGVGGKLDAGGHMPSPSLSQSTLFHLALGGRLFPLR